MKNSAGTATPTPPATTNLGATMRSTYRTGSAHKARPALRNTAMLSASAAIALMAAGCATAASEGTQEKADATSSETTSSGSSSASSSDYKDGTYSADGSYTSPGGQQGVSVEVTVADGVISDVTVTPGAVDSQSKRFQEDFAENVADQVVGKSLDDADVSVVASSSLTSEGFNEALAKIAEEAGA
jgi:uncharacterized protein with FMN-binding domain